MTRLRHTNLVNVLFYLPRPAVVLVPLLLKGLTLIVTLGVTAWLRSTWVDLCVLAAVIGYTLRGGVLCGMPWTGKCCASGRGSGFGKPPPFRRSGSRWWRRCGLCCCVPSGYVSLKRTPLRAAGGGRISGSISRRADTRALFHTHSDGDIDLPEQQQYRPRNASVLLLSLFTSNSLMGLILLAASLQKLGSIVGEDLSHRLMNRLGALGELLAFGVPPAAAMLALTAALGWSVAFLSEFLRNKNFLTVRTGRVLEVHRGLFTLRSCLVQADRIRFVQIRETAASRLLGLGAVYLHAVGVSRKQEDLLPGDPGGAHRTAPDSAPGTAPGIPARPAHRASG